MITLSDMHCHLLAGVDDGSRDVGMTAEMLRIAVKDGIDTMIVTPHFHPKRGHAGPEAWRSALLEARGIAEREELNIRLLPGCEIMYSSDAVQMLDREELWTMADSRYVLVEFSSRASYDYIRTGLQIIRMGGYLPILAHVERYPGISSAEQVGDMIGIGAYIQMNADTVLLGRKFLGGRYIRTLLKEEMIHFIGSDAHDTENRPPKVRDAYDYIKGLCGEKYARQVCCMNARRIAEGEIIDG